MCRCCLLLFFFFKQKTAYEMRISDWSSDVCSSDLHPQQPGLGLQRHVADLVQEQGAALRLLEAAGGPHGGAGERSLLVAEQLRLDQLARYRRHVERHERSVAPLAVVVQGARHQLLAGSGLAGDRERTERKSQRLKPSY